MEPSILAPWRDAAIILLVLEFGAMLIGPLVALFFAVKGVRWVKRKSRSPMLQARLWSQRIERGATRTLNAIAMVPINIQASGVRATVTTRGVINYILGR